MGGLLYDLTADYAIAYGLAALFAALNLVVVGWLYWRIRGMGGAARLA